MMISATSHRGALISCAASPRGAKCTTRARCA
jgi:hypothetical protein